MTAGEKKTSAGAAPVPAKGKAFKLAAKLRKADALLAECAKDASSLAQISSAGRKTTALDLSARIARASANTHRAIAAAAYEGFLP